MYLCVYLSLDISKCIIHYIIDLDIGNVKLFIFSNITFKF